MLEKKKKKKMASDSDDDEQLFDLESNLKNVVEQETLKWIFVGGKGGVGKTTTSASLALQLAKVRKSVLLISTDPAHNLSDAFCQKFTKDPTPVKGIDNLSVMEVDPSAESEELMGPNGLGAGNAMGIDLGDLGSMMKEISGAMPGVDEAMSFAQVLKLVKSLQFDVVVFDTAPTGHTLRLLSFPAVLDKTLGMFGGGAGGGKLGSLLSTVGSMFGGAGGASSSSSSSGGIDESAVQGKIASLKASIEEVNKQFADPDLTTFVCVMIPEFLSLYETERMIQELTRFKIDAHNIVINQVLFPEKDAASPCALCTARTAMQRKYIDQALELYEDFHITQLPLLKEEVRGVPALLQFGETLLQGESNEQ
jgi:arsenite/tail-anchored protein-transporting ATPase